MISLDIRVVGSNLIKHLMEDAIGDFHDVVFDERRHLLAVVGACIFEGIADDALTTGARDQLQTLIDIIGLAVLDPGIEVFLVLPDDHHIHIRMAGGDKRMIGNARPDV